MDVITNHLNESTEHLADLMEDIKEEIRHEATLIRQDIISRIDELTDKINARSHVFKVPTYLCISFFFIVIL